MENVRMSFESAPIYKEGLFKNMSPDLKESLKEEDEETLENNNNNNKEKRPVKNSVQFEHGTFSDVSFDNRAFEEDKDDKGGHLYFKPRFNSLHRKAKNKQM